MFHRKNRLSFSKKYIKKLQISGLIDRIMSNTAKENMPDETDEKDHDEDLIGEFGNEEDLISFMMRM